MSVRIDREKLKAYMQKNPTATYRQIAESFGCSISGVYFACREKHHGLTGTACDNEIKRILLDDPSISYVALAEQVGKSVSYVYSRVITMGLRSVNSHSEMRGRILEYAKSHPSATNFEIAEEVGCSNTTVSNVLLVAGLRKKRNFIDDDVLLQKLHENPNLSNQNLADFFGCATSSIAFAKRRAQGRVTPRPSFPSRRVEWDEVLPLLERDPQITAAEISRKLKTNPAAIYRVLQQHGYSTSLKSKINLDELMDELRKNPDASYVYLGEKFGCSKQAVYDFCKRHGLVSSRHKITGVTRKEVMDCIFANPDKTYAEIASMLGIEAHSVQRYALTSGFSKNRVKQAKKASVVSFAKAHPEAKICDIAEKFGFSSGFVSDLLVERGVRKKENFRADFEGIVAAIKKDPNRSRDSLASEFGCSASTISKVKERMKGVYRKETYEKRSTRLEWAEVEIILDKNPSITVSALAEQLGVSSSVIYRILRKHKRLRGHIRKVPLADLREMMENGKSLNEIAEFFGVCQQSVRNAMAKINNTQ